MKHCATSKVEPHATKRFCAKVEKNHAKMLVGIVFCSVVQEVSKYMFWSIQGYKGVQKGYIGVHKGKYK